MLRRTMLTAALLVLLAPAAASAATRPEVTTGGVADVTFSSATLAGKVDPNGAATTYFFEYGTTRLYGARTPAGLTGAGTQPRSVTAAVGGLAPTTRYHYRLVAQNAKGLAFGGDRTFTTRRQPNGVVLNAAPNPVAPGAGVTLSGVLTGTNNGGRQVQLLSNPWPYSQGFLATGNPVVTNADGTFTFNMIPVGVTTQFLVRMPAKPEVASPIVVVGAALQVTTRTKKVKRTRRSVTVRFRGTVTPAAPGLRVDIQRLKAGVWTTIAHTHTIDAGTTHSRYSTRVRIRRGGQFRSLVESQGQYVNGAGRVVTIHRHRH
jgi:hypothetical protein